MNGKIEFIRPLHFRGRAADSLLIVTVRAAVASLKPITALFLMGLQAKETLCILDYDAPAQSMITRLTGSLCGNGSRPPMEIKGCLDPECRSVSSCGGGHVT